MIVPAYTKAPGGFVTDPEQVRRTLNHWNATRHGWVRFQASSRRAAERIARRQPDTDPEDSQS